MSEQFSKAIEDLFNDHIIIETNRLIMNKINDDDLSDIWEIFGDEEVTKYTDFNTRKSLDDSKKIIDYFCKCYTEHEQYRFAIRLKSSGEMIGSIGIFNINEDSDLVEIGYELKRKYWKMGFMKEVISGLTKIYFQKMFGHRIEAIVSPGNVASERLLEKCCFIREGMFRSRDLIKGRYESGLIYGLLKDDIENQQMPS